MVRPGLQEAHGPADRGRRRCRIAGRPHLEPPPGGGNRRCGARQGRLGQRGKQAHHAGLRLAVRPDQPAARGQRPLRLLGQDHVAAGAKPVRAPQGPDLPANRFARPARGLFAHGQADVRDAGRQRHEAPRTPRPDRAQRQLHPPQQAHLRQHQGQRSLCHHPHAAGAQWSERGRAEAVRPGGAPFPGGVFPQRGIHGHHAHHVHQCPQASRGRCRSLGAARRLGPRGPPLQDGGQGAGQAGLDGRVRQRGGRRCDRRQRGRQGPEPRAGARGRDRADRGGGAQGPENQAACSLHRSHAAGGHGRRGQAGGRRRTAPGHAGKRVGHARHARGHHRRFVDRKIHAARRPGNDSHGQGLPAHDAAAWTGRAGTLQGRAHG